MHKYRVRLLFAFLSISLFASAQPKPAQNDLSLYPIRTITAGVTLKDLNDTVTLGDAIRFLKRAEKIYETRGYKVQTLRIATNNFPAWKGDRSYEAALPYLVKLDAFVAKE